MKPYLCPNCETNQSRFNLTKQRAIPVKMDPRTGVITYHYTNEDLDPFRTAYQGFLLRVVWRMWFS